MCKYLILLFALITFSFGSASSQTCEPNMDFELGTYSNWTYYLGSCCNGAGAILANGLVTGSPAATRFSLMSGTATDSCCGFPVVGEGVYSLKLGYKGVSNRAAEKVVYYVHVPATTSNYALIYRYAFVLEDPGHAAAQNPKMEIKVSDSATGLAVPYGSQVLMGTSAGTYMGTGTVKCRAWTTQSLDLSGYGGQTVKVEFAVGGCQPTGHFGYCYVDMGCGLFAIDVSGGCTTTLTAPSGFATYAWYDSATFTIFYGSSSSITPPPSGSAQHFAVIITPLPGFGPADTLYTTVNPLVCTAGTISAPITTACATSSVTLTNIGHSASICQWQSSPDSLTWTDIPGATNFSYTATGVATTTFFRNYDFCCLSGTGIPTHGVKITNAPCCSGTPTAGTAIASTSSCAACTLTLTLIGFTSAPGIAFQWQSSADGISWADIPGATTIPYTFTPSVSAYYRCRISCSTSGLSSFSNALFIPYYYQILTTSPSNVSSSACPGTGSRFYTTISGVSPLLRLKTYYGDGATDSIATTASGTHSYTDQNHLYLTSGTYTIRHILYWNNIPQDTATYSFDALHCKTLHLSLRYDVNSNCIEDAGESPIAVPIQIKVDSNGIAIDTIIVTSGLYYRALGPHGTIYSFSSIDPVFFNSCSIPFVYDTINSGVNLYPSKTLLLNCVGLAPDQSLYAVMTGTGGHAQVGNIYVQTTQCGGLNTSTTLNMSPKFQHYSSTPAPVSVAGTTINWDLPLVPAMPPRLIKYHLEKPWSTILSFGDTIHSNYMIIPASDTHPENNNDTRCDTVKASYDPNFIEVHPSGCFDVDTTLRYTIHFENLGNDTAHNVHIMDTLSENVDINSLKVLLASHYMNFSAYNDGPYNIVKFDFPDIKLGDSSQHDINDGAVFFSIKTKPGLTTGSAIRNRAGIYFDYNEVVMTNTVENVKGCPAVSVSTTTPDKDTYIYPNPATNELSIKANANTYTSFTITNSLGQTIQNGSLSGAITRVNIKSLPAGLYYVIVKGDNGSTTKKFVKM